MKCVSNVSFFKKRKTKKKKKSKFTYVTFINKYHYLS